MTTLSRCTRIGAVAGISVALVVAPYRTQGLEALRPPSALDAGVARSTPAIRHVSCFADGVYTATGEYGSLPSSITVTVTLADDVVTAVEVTPHATNPMSLDLQRRFAAAVPA